MAMPKETGYMCPELKKATAGDADLEVFSTWQVVKNSQMGMWRYSQRVWHEDRGLLGKEYWKNLTLRGQLEEESVRRLKQNAEKG